MTNKIKVIKMTTKEYLMENSSMKSLVLALYYYNNNRNELNSYTDELLRIVIEGINCSVIDNRDYGVSDLIRDIESILANDYRSRVGNSNIVN